MGNFFQLISKNSNNIKDFISIYLNKIINYRKLIIIEPKDYNIFDIKDIDKDYINKIINKQKIIKKRNAAVDMLRIITMIGMFIPMSYTKEMDYINIINIKIN